MNTELSALCQKLEGHFGCRVEHIHRLSTISHSRNYKVHMGGATYFVKQGAKVVGESENLRACRPPPTPGFTMSHAVWMDVASGLLVLRFEQGCNFLVRILKMGHMFVRPVMGDVLVQDVRRVARWLADFHQANAVDKKEVGSEEMEAALLRLDGTGSWLTASERARVRDDLKTLRLPALIRYRSNHDFSPRNILLQRNSGVTVVDWDVVLHKPAYYNLAYFTTNLEARSRLPLYSLRFQRRLSDEFLRAYASASGGCFDEEIYRVFKYLYLIEYLNGYENKTGVFEPWKHNRPSMDRFMRDVVCVQLRTGL